MSPIDVAARAVYTLDRVMHVSSPCFQLHSVLRSRGFSGRIQTCMMVDIEL